MIKDLFIRQKQFFSNISLKKKFMSIIIALLFLMLAGFGIGMLLVRRSDDLLLYNSTRGTVVYSAQVLSDRLQTVENMTRIMLGDSVLQENLAIADDPDATHIDKNNAFTALGSAVPNYYYNFKDGTGMRYISLYNDSYVSRSDYVLSANVAPERIRHLLDAAHTADGAPAWVTDYCQDSGLFLCRDVRRAKDLKLDTLGTILVNVDLNELIADTTAQMDQSGTTRYILYKDGQEIFHTDTFPENELQSLNGRVSQFSGAYGVIHLDDASYFYIKDTLPAFGWQFLALIPYTSVIVSQRVSLLFALLIMLVVLLLCLVLFNYLVNVITGHFTALIRKMDAFGEDETTLPQSDADYSSRSDEIGELHRRFDKMAVHVQDLIQKNYVNELLAKDAQFKFLESQINPHFLYNTLDSINWRAKALGDKDISTMVEALGALLRVTLSHKETISTIGSELEIVRNYMSIIQVRYDDRIEFRDEVPTALYEQALPQLTLQPLVENAINYALEEIPDTCTVQITGCLTPEETLLEITNNGSQFPEDLLGKLTRSEITPHGFGIGLLNIQKRLQLQFGPDFGLEFINDELRDLAIVRIHLPPKEGEPCIEC